MDLICREPRGHLGLGPEERGDPMYLCFPTEPWENIAIHPFTGTFSLWVLD